MRRWVPEKKNPSAPSIVSAIANVSSTDIIVSVAGRSRATSSRCIRTPMTKKRGTEMNSANNGSRPVLSWNDQAM